MDAARIAISLAATVVGTLAASARVATAGDAEDAAALRQAGRISDAVAKLDAAAKASPADAAIAVARADALTLVGRAAEGARAVDAALAKDAGSAALVCAKARALLAAADQALAAGGAKADVAAFVNDADRLVVQALSKDPKSADLRVVRAQALFQARPNDLSAPQTLVDDVLKDAPDHAGALMESGLLAYKRAERDRGNKEAWASAEKLLRAAFAADAANGEALFDAARASGWRGAQRKEVAAEFEKAALLLPGHEPPLVQLAKWAPNIGVKLAAFDRLAAKRPEDPLLQCYRAMALAEVDHLDDARAAAEKAAAIAPGDALPQVVLGDVLWMSKKQPEAIAAWIRAAGLPKAGLPRRGYDEVDYRSVVTADLTPEQVGNRTLITKDLSPEQREQLWEALVAAFPKVVDAPNNAATWNLHTAHDYKRSIQWYQRALAAAPDDPGLLNDIGLVYADPQYLNDPDRGEPFYRQAIEAAEKQGVNHPDRSVGYRDAVDNLTKLLVAKKRKADLIALCDQHLKTDPRRDTIRHMADTLGD